MVAGFILFLAVCVILCTLLISYVVIVYMRKKKKSQTVSLRKMSLRYTTENYCRNELYVKVKPDPPSSKAMLAISGFPQIEKSSIQYIRQLGQGNFGVVFHARVRALLNDEKETDVAVKTLKEEVCNDALDSFVREAKLMFSFDHVNIVKIFGVAMECLPYYLVFEFMDKGDLAQFLRANASSLQRHLLNPFDRSRSRTDSTQSDNPPSLNHHQLKDMCKQISAGMHYLASKNHVHRDLACRNCLVKSCKQENQTDCGVIIKIGDFGMSHNLYSSDYYRVKGTAVLPVRWMSPESVIYGKFSTESDVWSFGVVMWEVFSFAMQPYYGISNEEVTEAIRRLKILKQPANCPMSIYEIMKQCWDAQASLRPTFDELCDQLDKLSISESCSSSSPSIASCSPTSSDDDDCNSNSSDLDSDAFLEENSLDEMDAVL